jgi:hypothetical protein
MKRAAHSHIALTLATATVLLTACGGGNGDVVATPTTNPNVPGSDVPLSATTSSAGALAFVKSVAATSDNSATPLVIGDAVLATSDSDDPDAGI